MSRTTKVDFFPNRPEKTVFLRSVRISAREMRNIAGSPLHNQVVSEALRSAAAELGQSMLECGKFEVDRYTPETHCTVDGSHEYVVQWPDPAAKHASQLADAERLLAAAETERHRLTTENAALYETNARLMCEGANLRKEQEETIATLRQQLVHMMAALASADAVLERTRDAHLTIRSWLKHCAATEQQA